MSFPSSPSECCPTGSGCITDFLSGAGGVSGFNFIVQNSPFRTGTTGSDSCCDVLCSGFERIDYVKDGSIAYVSIYDGAGGYIENASGSSGITYTPTTMRAAPNTCCEQPPTFNPLPCVCTEMYTWSLTCTYEGTTTPSPMTFTASCACCISGYNNNCAPFLWDTDTCKFTGLLYDNDGYAISTLAGSGEIYFDPCKNKWVLSTSWPGSANQWPGGVSLFADVLTCTGLGEGSFEQPGDLPYGVFHGEGGGLPSGTVCYERADCGAPRPPDFPSTSKDCR